MRKWIIILGFTLMILLVSTSRTSASTIPVNISPGVTIQFSGQSAIGNDLFVSLGVNPGDRFALGLGYASPSGYFTLSTRYSPVRNFAIAVNYAGSNPAIWNLDFRMKHVFDESLALVGVIGYDGTGLNGAGQAEYWLTEQFSGNIGLGFHQSISLLILGGEFLFDPINFGLDCRFPLSSLAGQAQVVLFVAYKFN